MKQMKNRKKWIGTIVLSALLSAVALTVTLVVMLNVGSFPALADDPATTITIGSTEALINYSIEYAGGAHNPDDTLKLALSSGQAFRQTYTDAQSSQERSFVSIGSSSRPFNGKVEIADNATNVFVLDVPLFGSVTTKATIANPGGTAKELIFKRISSDTDAPLFAGSIEQGTGNPEAHFKVKLETDDITDSTNPTAYSFAGAVGTIKENSKVFFEFTHASSATVNGETVAANAQSASNIGLICGKMESGAELKAKVTATAGEFEIRSTGTGTEIHAGGLVGEMEEDSKIILSENFASVASVYSEHGYAGALVGYGVDALYEVQNSATATFSKTVSGNTGAGGLFGYLKCTDARTFDLSSISSDSNFIVTGSGNAGGVIGMLEAEDDITIDGHTTHTVANKDTFTRQVKLNGGTNRGGVIGLYQNNLLSHSLLVKDLKVSASSNTTGDMIGGVIGRISNDGVAAYVKITDTAVMSASGTIGGGLIGSMGDNGSFLDVDGMIALRGTFHSGLVKYQNAGVIRLKGYTDMGGGYFSANATANGAQLVGTRGNGLVYALGSGADTLTGYTSAGWTYRRCGSKSDDIGDWGEVVRVTSNTESTYFTPNMTAHTVTLAAAVNPMTSTTDFVKTALNIQHKVSDNISLSSGALLFASGSDSTTLLGNNLSITNAINLSNTGITGLTRDNGTNAAFSATFEGNNKTITLAIGENYGLNNSGTAVSGYGNNGHGTIIKHGYQGLFAKASGATFQNVTIAGNDSTTAADTTYIGGLAAQSTGNLTLSGVTVSHQVDVYESTKTIRCGGAVGIIAEGSTGTVSVNGSHFNCVINDARGDNANAYFGGVIGYVRSTSGQTFNVGTSSAVTLGGSYSKTNGSTGNTYYGGLIGVFYPASTNAGSNVRKVYVKNLTVSDSAAITTKNMNATARAGGAGALLGSVWPNVDVTIGTSGATDGVTVGTSAAGSPSIAAQGSANGNIGALFYKATGSMAVHHVAVNDLSVSSACTTSTFGFIVNDMYYAEKVDNTDYKSALYLNVDLTNYDIAATSVSGSFSTAYDEIAAYSVIKNKNIEENGQAIVSLELGTGVTVTMDGSNCNTYQNQTSYATKINPNTRYYYNLEAIRSKPVLSPKEKLLMWSVYTYGHTSLRSDDCLKSSYNISSITGNCDMEGLSYYPVNASGMTISDATIKFYNSEIENGESGTGNSDSSVRSTGIGGNTNVSQHYLMHTGLFLDYTGTLTISGTNKLQGNVGKTTVRNDGSGFIVSRTLGGNVNRTTIVKTNAGAAIELDGAVIAATVTNGAVENKAGSVYAPLLINKIGSNTNVELSGVKTVKGADRNSDNLNDVYAGLSGDYAASSLIGDVGSDTAASITLKFSNIVLDARKGTLNDGDQTAAYFSERSIFSQATLLNSFTYNDSSTSGTYDYKHEEDWNGTNSLHQVTYGWEVTHSLEYTETVGSDTLSRERFYIDTQTSGSEIRTNPLNSTDTAYDFSASNYLPYVHVSYNAANHKHELKVNIAAAALEEGCGKYNDPYKIAGGDTGGDQLYTIAKIIQGSYTDGMTIILPINNSGYTLNTSTWHGSGITDYTFRYSSSKFECTIDGSVRQIDPNDVREYLAGAYYYISGAITLPSGFPGLGAYSADVSNYEAQYAFRGVIVGNSSANPTITNKSGAPLIKNANGCVVKNVSVSAEPESAIALNVASSHVFTYNNGDETYGALIGQVMGGDNIIDHVGVSFSSASITINDNGFKRLAAVGGYIGALVNGGVIFRNMTANLAVGLTSDTCAYVSDAGWLYVNPIIGRVIAGYAFEEGSTYAIESSNVVNSVTVSGSTTYKNYAICTLNPDSGNKLTVNATGTQAHTITIPDAQAFYILSCIVNSGAGSAAYHANTEQAYPTIGDTPWIAYRNYTSTRCAMYDRVGIDGIVNLYVKDDNGGITAQLNGTNKKFRLATSTDNNLEHYIISNNVATNVSDYDKVTAQDVYSGSTKVPYIIRNYTTSTGALFRARSLTNSNSLISNITLGDNFNTNAANNDLKDGKLPKSYRGIGSIYSDNTNLIVGLKEFNGNNKSIVLDMRYTDYLAKDGHENYCSYGTSYDTQKAGFGLFNRFANNVQHSDDNRYVKDKQNGNQVSIKNLNISGSVYYNVYHYSGRPISYATGDGDDGVDRDTNLSVGALVGFVACPYKIQKVNIDGIVVEGVRYTGGLIGHTSTRNFNRDKQREIIDCGASTSAITVISGSTGGGLVGYAQSTWLSIYSSSTANPVSLKINKVFMKGEETVGGYNESVNACVGGLVGFADCGRKKNNPKNFSVKNYNIIGLNSSSSFIGTDSTFRFNTETTKNGCFSAGGVCGAILNSEVEFDNVYVSDLNIKAIVAGGIVGRVYQMRHDVDVMLDLKNFGYSDGTISGSNYAGGIIGHITRTKEAQGNEKIGVSADNCSVINATITQFLSQNDTAKAASAFVAGAKSTEGKILDLILRNATFDHCTVSAYFSGNKEHYGLGTLVGSALSSNDTHYTRLSGSNILINDISLNRYYNGAISNDRSDVAFLVGNNYNNKNHVMLVGVSINIAQPDGCPDISRNCGNCKDNILTTENYGSKNNKTGYIVFADFNGSSVRLSQNTADSDLYDSTNDYAAASPFVTVNPGVHIGNGVYLLTGDGMAATVAGLPINAIFTNNGAAPYNYSASSLPAAGDRTAFLGRFSTYNVEQNAVLTNDFAVLVLEDTNRNNTTALFNQYLNLLANTQFTYQADMANVFDVKIYRMTWNGTTWVQTDENDTGSEPNLKSDGTHIFMTSENVDTAGQMFSLIDVQFKDPADTSKIAYHLYVPVIVKKMLRYDFEIATGAGTNYERGWYDGSAVEDEQGAYVLCAANETANVKVRIEGVDVSYRLYRPADDAGKTRYTISASRWGKPLMENLGTPSTVYFKFTYKRTVGEWQHALDNGENLLRNYAKTLNLAKSNNSVPNLPAGTILVLVDPNNGCKPYYYTVPAGGLSGVLSLFAFHENLDGTGDPFAPVDLNDLLHIKATADNNNGAYVAVGNGETPTVEADKGVTGGYKLKTGNEPSGTTFYRLTIVDEDGNEYADDTQALNLPERYYLSFFTEAEDSSVVYHYIINAPTSFGDSAHPSKVDFNGNAHLILGNIFEQSGFAVRATNSNEEISPDNNHVDVTMTSTVKIYSGLYDEVNAYLSDSANGINVYQSFLLYLTKEDADGTLKMITGSPNVTGSYTITSSNNSVTAINDSYAAQNSLNAAFAEFKNGESLNDFLTSASGQGAVITATIQLVYPNSDSISEQFPDRSGNAQSEYGTSVSGSSHVGYDPDKAAYSKIATHETDDSNNRSYYCLLKPRSAKLSYIAMTDIEGDYAQLGINPLDIDELNAFAVSTIGTYDFSDILAEANVEETVEGNSVLKYSRVKCELKLMCRQDDYATDKKISDYFTAGPTFVGATPISAAYSNAGETVFTIVLDRDDVKTPSSDAILRLPIDFSVLTGAAFETAGYYYSNYKVTLDVTLIDASGNELAISHASNYIVYTNACIYPDFIG